MLHMKDSGVIINRNLPTVSFGVFGNEWSEEEASTFVVNIKNAFFFSLSLSQSCFLTSCTVAGFSTTRQSCLPWESLRYSDMGSAGKVLMCSKFSSVSGFVPQAVI